MFTEIGEVHLLAKGLLTFFHLYLAALPQRVRLQEQPLISVMGVRAL